MKFRSTAKATGRTTCLFCGIMFDIVLLVLALTPTKSYCQTNSWVMFNTDNSELPDNNVLSLAMDSYDNKWIGTKFGGLVKFDGEEWRIFLPDSAILFPPLLEKQSANFLTSDSYAGKTLFLKNAMASGPQFNAFYDLAIDANDTKWIGSKIGGLIKFDGADWKVFNTDNSGIPDNYAWSLALDDEGDKWIGTKKGGVAKFDGSKWTVFAKNNSGLPDNDICSVTVDKAGNKWIGTSNGLAKFDGKNWTVYRTENSGLPANAVCALTIDHKNNIWIGTHNGGVAKFDGAKWKVYNKANSALPSDDIYSIAFEKANNSVWIGTVDAGLAKFDGLNWTIFNTLNSGLPQNYIKDILIDNQGNKWIGTELGLAIYREDGVILSKIVENFSLSQNYPNPFNAATEFSFDLPRRTWANISIYNLLGQLILIVTSKEFYAGTYFERWNGRTKDGNPASAGLYLYRMKTDFGTRSRKMILIR
jgi:ligand-binding sensor domain-containing protein